MFDSFGMKEWNEKKVCVLFFCFFLRVRAFFLFFRVRAFFFGSTRHFTHAFLTIVGRVVGGYKYPSPLQ